MKVTTKNRVGRSSHGTTLWVSKPRIHAKTAFYQLRFKCEAIAAVVFLTRKIFKELYASGRQAFAHSNYERSMEDICLHARRTQCRV